MERQACTGDTVLIKGIVSRICKSEPLYLDILGALVGELLNLGLPRSLILAMLRTLILRTIKSAHALTDKFIKPVILDNLGSLYVLLRYFKIIGGHNCA
jgi:hypothetical protein